MDNTKVVDKLIDCYAKKSTKEMPFDENIIYTTPLHKQPLRGKAQVLQHLNKLFDQIEVKKAVVEKHVASGNNVCTLWDYFLEPDLKIPIFVYYELENGKIKLMRTFYDPRPLLEHFK